MTERNTEGFSGPRAHTETVHELQPSARGTWEVRTQAATYLISLDESTLARYPAPSSATGFPPPSELRRDATKIPLLALLQCRVGRCLIVLLDIRGDGVETTRISTDVVSIRNVRQDQEQAGHPDG